MRRGESFIASVRCKSTKISNALFKVVYPRSKAQVKIHDYEVYLEQPVEPDDFPALQKHFDDLGSSWIGYATAIGGLGKHLNGGESE